MGRGSSPRVSRSTEAIESSASRSIRVQPKSRTASIQRGTSKRRVGRVAMRVSRNGARPRSKSDAWLAPSCARMRCEREVNRTQVSYPHAFSQVGRLVRRCPSRPPAMLKLSKLLIAHKRILTSTRTSSGTAISATTLTPTSPGITRPNRISALGALSKTPASRSASSLQLDHPYASRGAPVMTHLRSASWTCVTNVMASWNPSVSMIPLVDSRLYRCSWRRRGRGSPRLAHPSTVSATSAGNPSARSRGSARFDRYRGVGVGGSTAPRPGSSSSSSTRRRSARRAASSDGSATRSWGASSSSPTSTGHGRRRSTARRSGSSSISGSSAKAATSSSSARTESARRRSREPRPPGRAPRTHGAARDGERDAQ